MADRDALSPASLDGAPFRWSMGLHRLEPSAWLDVDARRDAELADKRRLLAEAREEVLVRLPRGAAPSEELRELVLADLRRHHGGLGADDGRLDPDPLADASRRVQEDLCLLAADEGAWRLVAACVCFPSRWSLREKLGASLAEIHGPVPGFEASLSAPAARFFDRLTVERPVWRSNWTLLDTDVLHLPSPAARRSSAPLGDDVGALLFFRVERQTLRRLARTGAVAFTIRTTVRPLTDALAATPGAAAALRATLATVPADVAAYKGWTRLLEPLVAWLARPEAVDAEH